MNRCLYNGNQTSEDGSRGNFQNIVHIKYIPNNGWCPLQLHFEQPVTNLQKINTWQNN